MKTLPQTFTKKGWEHSQVTRSGNLAIYSRSKPDGLPAHFELVRIRQAQVAIIHGREIPALSL